ncbi:MAG: GNAT family N-acetyltransferase [Edaphobacter sp.]|uniref:GNAT family N-acetyltransferase n=1 Tax=Edaphobacter sp. TaxID=1934404 RepID=UPI00239CE996|nr:GNAT family N-acetyltransferase [Edaphobacter sp.]MDE1177878.1 GNAT family N-acetyltransferase [Edaphobacter sp.]
MTKGGTTATDGRTLTIRGITMDDAVEVAALSCQLGYESTAEDLRRRLEEILPLKDDHGIFIASLGDEVVGWGESEIMRHLQSDAHALITGLVVKDGIRSMGVGSRLCEAIESWVKGRGVAVIRVTSRSIRERAHRFYLREGYTEIKISKVFEKSL